MGLVGDAVGAPKSVDSFAFGLEGGEAVLAGDTATADGVGLRLALGGQFSEAIFVFRKDFGEGRAD